MKVKTAMGVALLVSLSFAPTWVMADSTMVKLPLDASATEGSTARARVADNNIVPIGRQPSVRADEVTASDCFYAANQNEQACQSAEERTEDRN
jgi:hypothetical protein